MQAPRLKTRKPPAGEKAPRPILPSMAFPQNYLGNGVESVSIDGASIPLRHLGRSGDGFYHIVRVPSGKHAVHIVYSGKLIEAIVPEL